MAPPVATATKRPNSGDHAHPYQSLPVLGEVVERVQVVPFVLYAARFVAPLLPTVTKIPPLAVGDHAQALQAAVARDVVVFQAGEIGGTINTFDFTLKAPIFAVPLTLNEVAATFVVQKLFENQAFPWIVRFALGTVPIPTFVVARKVPTFAVVLMFALVAATFVVQKLFENQAFPWTVRFALGVAPIPKLLPEMRFWTFAVPTMFALVTPTFVVQKLFENQAFP